MTKQHLLITGAPRSGTTLLANMIGRHAEIVLFIATKRMIFNRIVSKTVVGNTVCVPDDIDFKKQRRNGGSFYSVRPLETYLKFPNLRVILAVHDGHRVMAAIMRHEGEPFAAAAPRWCRAVTVMHELKQRLQQNALVVSMAHVLADPEGAMRRVAAFLGLEYQVKMLDGWQDDIEDEQTDFVPVNPPIFDLKNLYPEVWAKHLELCAPEAGEIKEEH